MAYRPTLSDVAKLAGVSVATASRALSNPGLVAARTRASVQDAVEACGYQINLLARSLRTQRTNAILVLIPDIVNQFYPEIIRGLEERAHALGYSMILGMTGNVAKRENSYLDVVNSRRADGLVILDGGLDRMIDKGVQFDVPVVQVLECLGGSSIPTVRIDDHKVAAIAVEHLAGLGHRHIAHISGSGNSLVASERIEGFRQAMTAAGIAVDPQLITSGNYTYEGGAAAMQRLFDCPTPPTAVFCANDASAFGAIRACRQRGLIVPDDISIIGVDDIEDAAASDPPLTTIRQPRYDIGVKALDVLIALIDRTGSIDRTAVFPVQLVTRNTTAPPRR